MFFNVKKSPKDKKVSVRKQCKQQKKMSKHISKFSQNSWLFLLFLTEVMLENIPTALVFPLAVKWSFGKHNSPEPWRWCASFGVGKGTEG